MTDTVIIPTMHLSAPYLEDPREQIMYVLRHFTSIPSGISKSFIPYEISFQKLNARHSGNLSGLCDAVSNTLTNTYKRIFPNADSINVNANPVDIDGTRYNISIDISIVIDNEIVDFSSIVNITSDNQISLQLLKGL